MNTMLYLTVLLTVTLSSCSILRKYHRLIDQKEKFVLAVVVVDGEQAESVQYIPMPFTQEPDWAEASKNLDLGLLLARAVAPAALGNEG